MSNSVGRIFTQEALFCPSVVQNQSKAHHGAYADSCAVPSASKAENAVSHSQKPLLSTRFLGKTLIARQGNLFKQSNRIPHAVFAADHSSGQGRKFNLDTNSELEINVFEPTLGSLVTIEFQVTNSNSSLVLHWGAIRHKTNGWALPSRRPDGTKIYNNEALRTPFTKSGSTSSLKIEIDDPEIQAVEFLLVNEAENKWFKNNGQNFQIQLPRRDRSAANPNAAVPEELVQTQARRRWEKNGRPTYTPDQEKKEHEAARTELLEELSRGTSVEELRSRLTKKPVPGVEKSATNETLKGGVPDDLVGALAYIRWEKAGKPNYSPDEKHREIKAARKQLQLELDKGTSLAEIQKMIVEGSRAAKDSKQAESKSSSTGDGSEQGKKDNIVQFCKNIAKVVEQKFSQSAKEPAVLELWSKAITEQGGESIMKANEFKLGDKNLQVVVSKPSGRTKVYLATDHVGPLILHWALSRKSGEWLVPPSSVAPSGSVMLDGSCQTPFTDASIGDMHYKTIVIEIDGGDYTELPFVLLSDGNWIKNNGMDFNIALEIGSANQNAGDGRGTAKLLLDQIAELEGEAQKSFMHRFRIAADLTEQAKDEGQLGLVGILVWMRFMAIRQLIWNKNYNVKPSEISQTQDKLTCILQNIYKDSPEHREFVRMIMASVGRGGEGDVGQRIRDEILVIQRNNHCEGGMMEEWHQKLHNNTSPDDVVICQALIDYIKSDFNISVYWDTLNKNGITKERLLSYDRAIHSEPSFGGHQKDGLLRDLGNYMRTLKAVHSGADLESAIATCMGYKSEGQGFMVGVQINPIGGLPSGFPDLMRFMLEHVEDKTVEPLVQALLKARMQLKPLLGSSHERLKDLIFLDISLDSTVRTALERVYKDLNNAEPEKIMYLITLVLENLALSTDESEDLIFCIKGWNHATDISKQKDDQWALIAKSCLDRTRLALSTKAEHYHQILQPSAEYLGALLGVEQWAISVFSEEIIRAGSAASLSTLLNRLDPILREVAHLGSWQIISPVEVAGYVEVVDELLAVQDKSYKQPTILIAQRVKGEEEIPEGTVAVLTPDMPDVLSHVSVRARNSKVCFATCFDANILAEFEKNVGKLFRLKPTSANILYSEIQKSELHDSNASKDGDEQSPSLTLVRKQFSGRYAISAEEFTSEMVGAKSRNISYLKGKVPSWVEIPTSVALPFGVFEEVVSDAINKEVASKLQTLKRKLSAEEPDALDEIRNTVLELSAPPKLVQELKQTMLESGMPWPGDEGDHRWELAWMAIKRVWASKWNERAYYSTRKVKLDHDCLCMAVLVQEIISADYAFVIHTSNPSSGDSSEIYAEVVKGLGETLVGASPGRALSFVCKKSGLDSPKVLGYPSKPIGLFIKRSIIFRSDSNGEDLEGYAGAGLYDSVSMDEEEKVVLDYVSDPLMMDKTFQSSILSFIAKAGHAIEEIYGYPQDIEGVVKDGKIYIVQTRPQM